MRDRDREYYYDGVRSCEKEVPPQSPNQSFPVPLREGGMGGGGGMGNGVSGGVVGKADAWLPCLLHACLRPGQEKEGASPP